MFTVSFALLALASFALVAGVALASALLPTARAWWIFNIGPYALPLAALVAVVTTLGSLYLSEVLHYLPCRLCWAQRAMAYPLALILPAALVTKRSRWQRLAFPMATIGALMSCFHILIEHFPNLESSTCDPTNPCSLLWVRHFGFVTIPVMALASFLLHLLLATTAEHFRKA
jgi:disulfide bond formation protein DsbB